MHQSTELSLPIKLNIEGTFNYSPTFTDKSSYSRQNGYWDYVTDQRVSESALENASITNTSARTWRQSAEILVRYQTTIKKDHDLAHYSDIPHRNITARALPFPVKELLTGH